MKILKKIILLISSLATFAAIFYIGIYIYAKTWPKLDISTANSFYLYDNENHLFTGGNSNDWISLDNISKYMVDATISIEDKNFYNHKGFDFPRIIKAMYINIINRNIIEFKDYYNIENYNLVYDEIYKIIINKKIDEDINNIEQAIKHSVDYVNNINDDKKLECLSTIMILIKELKYQSELDIIKGFRKWSKEKSKKFSDKYIIDSIKYLEKTNIISKGLLGYFLVL